MYYLTIITGHVSLLSVKNMPFWWLQSLVMQAHDLLILETFPVILEATQSKCRVANNNAMYDLHPCP
jgi:hypothetical protein